MAFTSVRPGRSQHPVPALRVASHGCGPGRAGNQRSALVGQDHHIDTAATAAEKRGEEVQPVSGPDAPQEAQQPARRVQVGTGMPESILLNSFGQWLQDAYGEVAYHVGSSMYGKNWRDVDVRMMLDDPVFDEMFPGYRFYRQEDAKWALLCAAISRLGASFTGLPIDFQFQRVSEANAMYRGARNPLSLFDISDVRRETWRARERAEAARGATDNPADTTHQLPPDTAEGRPADADATVDRTPRREKYISS